MKGGNQLIASWGLQAVAFFGVGLGGGRQKWGNLPEAHTDFIFAVIGEELGVNRNTLYLGTPRNADLLRATNCNAIF